MSTHLTPPRHTTIRLKGFSPTWIGPDPYRKGFIAGSRDGVIALIDEQGKEFGERREVSPSKSAINGIDGIHKYLAVTTPQEITVVGFPDEPEGRTRLSVIEQGAHSVTSCSSAYFLAPLGHHGIGVLTPGREQKTDFHLFKFVGDVSCYRIVEMPAHGNRNRFVVACRTHGVGFLDCNIDTTKPALRVGSISNADVIDVVAVTAPDHPHAFAAVGSNGELLLCRDAINQAPPITLHYEHLAGTVYRIFATNGHLILLTGKAFYVLADLGRRLAQPVYDQSNSPIMTVPVDSIDGFVYEDRWLMILTPSGIRKYDLKSISDKIAMFAAASSKPQRKMTQKKPSRQHYVPQFMLEQHVVRQAAIVPGSRMNQLETVSS
jgi:hypothetical protein